LAAIGGTTVDLPRAASALSARLGHAVAVDQLGASQTVQEVAELIRPHVEAAPGLTLRPLRSHGTLPPLFLFHPAGGPTSVYRSLVELLGDDRPCFGLERIDEWADIPDKATRYIELLRDRQPTGPYHLAGWSFGGYLAYEVASQLETAGERVASVALIDAVLPLPTTETSQDRLLRRLTGFTEYAAQTYQRPLHLPYAEVAALAGRERDQIDLVIDALAAADIGLTPAILRHQRDSLIDLCCLERYEPRPFGGPVLLFRTAEETPFNVRDPRFLRTDPAGGWDALCRDLTVVPVTGHHLNVLDPPHVELVAAHLIHAPSRVGSPS
jgi:phthiocerol/phenolphthiocerol synthesis type-I polyketide synthase D